MQEFCCFDVNAFILLYFLRWQGGATAPLATPLDPPLYIYIYIRSSLSIVVEEDDEGPDPLTYMDLDQVIVAINV